MDSWQVKILSPDQQISIKQKIKSLEEKTGAELVVVIAKSSDPYPAASLRMAIFFTMVSSFFIGYFYTLPTSTAFILVQFPLFVVGLFLSHLDGLRKIFYSSKEVNREVREKAQELFTNLGLVDASERSGSLLLFSVAENKLELIVDTKLKSRMSHSDLEIIGNMIKKQIDKKNYFVGLLSAIEMLEDKYLHFFPDKVSSGEIETRYHETLSFIDFSEC